MTFLFRPMFSVLMIFPLFASVLCASMMNETSYEDTFSNKTVEDFGMFNAFYHWSTVAAKAPSEMIINKDIVEALRNATYGNRTDAQQKKELWEKLLLKTGKSLHYVFVSMIIAVLLFVVGLVVLLLQCCCRLKIKAADKENSAAVWKTSIYSVFFAIIFCFILSGTIIHGISSSYLLSTIDNTENYASSLSPYFEAITENANDSLIPLMDSILKNATNELSDNMGKLRDSTIENVRMYYKLSSYDQIIGRYTEMGDLYKKMLEVKDDEKGWDIYAAEMDDRYPSQECLHDLDTTLKFSAAYRDILKSHKKELESRRKSYEKIMSKCEKAINKTIVHLSTTVLRDATRKWESMRQKLIEITNDNILEENRKLAEKVNEAVNEMRLVKLSHTNEDLLLSLWKVLFIVATLPAPFVLLLLLSSFILVLLKVLSQIVKLKVHTEGFAKKLSLIGFYTICFLSWVVILLSCGEYIISWSLSGICFAFFDDAKFSIYGNLTITVKDYKRNEVKLPLDEIIQRCQNEETLYRIAEDYMVFNITSLIEQSAIKSKEKAFMSAAYRLQRSINHHLRQPTTQLMEMFERNPKVYDGLKRTVAGFKNLMRDCDFFYTESDYIGFELSGASIESHYSYLYNYYKELHDNHLSHGKLSSVLRPFHKSAFNMAVTANERIRIQLTHRLFEDVYSCRAIYDIYMHAGSLLCRSIRYPLSGMWAAAVIIWTSLLPAAVIFYMRADLVRPRKTPPAANKQQKNGE